MVKRKEIRGRRRMEEVASCREIGINYSGNGTKESCRRIIDKGWRTKERKGDERMREKKRTKIKI
jgi:hypothetical protein